MCIRTHALNKNNKIRMSLAKSFTFIPKGANEMREKGGFQAEEIKNMREKYYDVNSWQKILSTPAFNFARCVYQVGNRQCKLITHKLVVGMIYYLHSHIYIHMYNL